MAEKLFSDSFQKKSKLGISLDRWCKALYKLFLLHFKLTTIHIY